MEKMTWRTIHENKRSQSTECRTCNLEVVHRNQSTECHNPDVVHWNQSTECRTHVSPLSWRRVTVITLTLYRNKEIIWQRVSSSRSTCLNSVCVLLRCNGFRVFLGLFWGTTLTTIITPTSYRNKEINRQSVITRRHTETKKSIDRVSKSVVQKRDDKGVRT